VRKIDFSIASTASLPKKAAAKMWPAISDHVIVTTPPHPGPEDEIGLTLFDVATSRRAPPKPGERTAVETDYN
jgi:hypothetical protein